ncbi:MAG: glucose 1-dehydrogenase [Calditrichia bacterium]
MKALAIKPGTKELKLVDRSEPKINEPDEVKIRIIRVGICGTDREEANGGRARAPEGKQDLVLGHEMFGQVVETGTKVSRVKKGDFAVFTVRRGCGKCLPCAMNRPDMCKTGDYVERGIWGMDGFQTQYVVDKEQYIVRVPAEIEPLGVLSEPLAVAEKAIDEAVRVQFARLPDAPAYPEWLYGRRCLVAGLGPIGLLASLALIIRGAEVYGLDIVPEDSVRPSWLKKIGGKYINGKAVPADKVDDKIGAMDLIFEATGIPTIEFDLLDALSINGVYVLTGIPGGDRPIQVDAPQLLRKLVLENQLMLGSVNEARDHFQMAVDDLLFAHLKWGGHINKLITNRHKFDDFDSALTHHGEDEIKVVLEWSNPEK